MQACRANDTTSATAAGAGLCSGRGGRYCERAYGSWLFAASGHRSAAGPAATGATAHGADTSPRQCAAHKMWRELTTKKENVGKSKELNKDRLTHSRTACKLSARRLIASWRGYTSAHRRAQGMLQIRRNQGALRAAPAARLSLRCTTGRRRRGRDGLWGAARVGGRSRLTCGGSTTTGRWGCGAGAGEPARRWGGPGPPPGPGRKKTQRPPGPPRAWGRPA